ncbi:MAG: hypothetical protein WEE53_02720, partial [Acidimicrobiia bacterium]
NAPIAVEQERRPLQPIDMGYPVIQALGHHPSKIRRIPRSSLRGAPFDRPGGAALLLALE